MLKIENLSVHYGLIKGVKEISFDVEEGKIISLIGSNGAGKTSTLEAIVNAVKTSGEVIFLNKAITKKKTHSIVQEGISLVPEGRRVFINLTVDENLLIGGYNRDNEEKEKIKQHCYELFPRLLEKKEQLAGVLSGGEQQMLAMGRGLMSNPDLILLDEPSLGLAPLLVKTIFEIIQDIKKMNKTILVVEQNAFKALSIADIAYVLEQGHIIKKGLASDLIKDPSIQEAYLGKKKED